MAIDDDRAIGVQSADAIAMTVQALLFHGCEQLLAGLLAAAAGFGAHATVLVHRSVPLTLVPAAPARRHARLQQ